MLKRLIIIVMCAVCWCGVLCAQEVSYLTKAQELFDAGKYEQAQKALNMYVTMTSNTDTVFESNITTCLKLVSRAKDLEVEGLYGTAIMVYKNILTINPKDPNVAAEILRLENRAASSKSQSPAATLGYLEIPQLKLAVQTKDVSTSPINYEQAMQLAEMSSVGGFHDWRLPTAEELVLIASYQEKINSAYFQQFGTAYREGYYFQGRYWSSTFKGKEDGDKNVWYSNYVYSIYKNNANEFVGGYTCYFEKRTKKTIKSGTTCQCRLVRSLE